MPLFPLRMLTVPLSSYAPRYAIPVIVIILSLRLSLLVLPFSLSHRTFCDMVCAFPYLYLPIPSPLLTHTRGIHH